MARNYVTNEIDALIYDRLEDWVMGAGEWSGVSLQLAHGLNRIRAEAAADDIQPGALQSLYMEMRAIVAVLASMGGEAVCPPCPPADGRRIPRTTVVGLSVETRVLALIGQGEYATRIEA